MDHDADGTARISGVISPLASRATPSRGTIRIAAALLNRSDGRTLLVRKRGTDVFMQPGGKIEPAEEPASALCRELFEELGLTIRPADLAYLGRFQAPAANEDGWTVEAEVFRLLTDAAVAPAGEIEDLAWIDPLDPGSVSSAPLTRDYLLPLACRISDV